MAFNISTESGLFQSVDIRETQHQRRGNERGYRRSLRWRAKDRAAKGSRGKALPRGHLSPVSQREFGGRVSGHSGSSALLELRGFSMRAQPKRPRPISFKEGFKKGGTLAALE
jgi:hypothetical protein